MSHTLCGDLFRSPAAPDQPAILCGQESLSYRDLFTDILCAESGFRALGVGKGDRVAILTLNTPESVIAFYALARIGAVSCWVDMKLAPDEVERTLQGFDVVLMLASVLDKVYRNRGTAHIRRFIVLPAGRYLPASLAAKVDPLRELPPGCTAWDDFLREHAEELPQSGNDADVAAIVYTGGTTGPSKGVMLTGEAFHISLEQYRQTQSLYGAGGKVLNLLPVFSGYGLCQCIHLPLCFGMTLVFAPMFRSGQLRELLLRYRPEQVDATTFYWQRFLDDPETKTGDFSFLRNLRSGGDAMPAELEQRIRTFLSERAIPAAFINEYGMSETCGMVCVPGFATEKPGSIGRPLPGNEMSVADPDTGRELPPGESGEILVRAVTQMRGYEDRPDADAELFRPGPQGKIWLWTRDIGHRDTDGDYFITGRAKRMLSRNGFKIFPSEIESFLLTLPEVAACAVVAGINREGETVPVAYIIPAAGVSPDEDSLRRACRAGLNLFMIPERFRFCGEFPLTDRGKLDYRELERRDRELNA